MFMLPYKIAFFNGARNFFPFSSQDCWNNSKEWKCLQVKELRLKENNETNNFQIIIVNWKKKKKKHCFIYKILKNSS